MLDYLIVGLGLAGISFAEQLEKNGKSHTVISDDSQISSAVAGGLYNSVILKRFTLAWKAKEQLDRAIPFYTGLEKKLGITLNHKLPVYRRFASVAEQNAWFEAADKPGLEMFLSPRIHPNRNPHINAPFGYGEVMGTGRIDTALLITSYKEYLRKKQMFLAERFDYETLQIGKDHVRYFSRDGRELRARRIVFAEGFGMKQNPFFQDLPMQGSKGEYLFIKAPELREQSAIKSSVFVIPEGEATYRVGANYGRDDKTNIPTEAARNELLKKWEDLVRCDYEVVDQIAGVRPTVKDRRPLVGRHPEHHRLYVLNGFGSRGVLIAPYAAEGLFEYIERNVTLPASIDSARFER